MKLSASTIARRALEKSPTCHRTGIAGRFCLTVIPLETGFQGERPARGRDRAFHNRAPGGAATPSWRVNPGLCSSRGVGVWRQVFPATSPFSHAISLPARRSDFYVDSSTIARLTARLEKSVFTQTQLSFPKSHIFGLAFYGRIAKNIFHERVNTSRRVWAARSRDREISRDYPMQNVHVRESVESLQQSFNTNKLNNGKGES